jgi:hypothetical protein
MGGQQMRRRLQARRAAGTLSPAAAAAGLLSLLAAAAGFAALLAPGRRARRPRRQPRGGVQMGQCDDCHRLYAANALRMKFCELHGTEGWWILCPVCRGDSREPQEPGGEIPSAPADPATRRELGERDGYAAAEYAELSGEPVRTPDRRADMTDDDWLYYQDGWGQGIESFTDADLDDLIREHRRQWEERPGPPAEPLPAGWSRRVDGLPETAADTRFFDLRNVIGWRGGIDQDGLPLPGTDAAIGAEQAREQLERLAGQARPFLLTVRRADSRPAAPDSPDVEVTLAIWSGDDLEARLAQIGLDPALEASVAVPVTARPRHDQPQDQPPQEEPTEEEPTEGEPEDMADGTSGGDVFNHGAFNAAVTDIHKRLGQLPAQTQKMLAGLSTAEAGRDQVNGVTALESACSTYQEMVMDMFKQVNEKELPVVEAYAGAGGTDNAPKPGYFAEV